MRAGRKLRELRAHVLSRDDALPDQHTRSSSMRVGVFVPGDWTCNPTIVPRRVLLPECVDQDHVPRGVVLPRWIVGPDLVLCWAPMCVRWPIG